MPTPPSQAFLKEADERVGPKVKIGGTESEIDLIKNLPPVLWAEMEPTGWAKQVILQPAHRVAGLSPGLSRQKMSP